MTEEKLDLHEEEETLETSSPGEGSESEETSDDFESLFEESEDDSQEDDPVKKLEAKVNSLEKGIRKAFSKQGVEKKKEGAAPIKAVKTSADSEVVEELLLTKHPEAEYVLDDLNEVAAQKGVSVLKLYRESKYFQGEAKAIAEAKRLEDEARGKIGNPSNGTGAGKQQSIEFSKIDLENPEHTKWLRSNPKRLEDFNKWILSKK